MAREDKRLSKWSLYHQGWQFVMISFLPICISRNTSYLAIEFVVRSNWLIGMATSQIRGGCTMRGPKPEYWKWNPTQTRKLSQGKPHTRTRTRWGLEIHSPPKPNLLTVVVLCCVVSMFPCNLFSRPMRQAQLPKPRSTYVCDRP